MSTLTRCNRCTLLDLQRRWGRENVRTVPGPDGWIQVERRTPFTEWQEAGHWFLDLSDGCVC